MSEYILLDGGILTDKRKPRIISDSEVPDIVGQCSRELWTASDGATGEEEMLAVDIGCPMKLQEVHIINGFGDFATKSFSVFGSKYSKGPWDRLYMGKLVEEVKVWTGFI